MKTPKIVSLDQHSFLQKMRIARKKLNDGCDGTVEFCDAYKLWMHDPLRYESLTPGLIDELLETALHYNATGGSANVLRANLKEHLTPFDHYETPAMQKFFKDRSLEVEALSDPDLCKLQSYHAIQLLTEVANYFYEDFNSRHISKLLTYAHLAETNHVCAEGTENVYDCLQILAAMKPEAFTNYHRATIVSKLSLDVSPITERQDAGRYWPILLALEPEELRPFRRPRLVRPSPTALYPYRVPSNDAKQLVL